jgi:GGDEF domain-containing protein/CHASE3 domain sensor protein
MRHSIFQTLLEFLTLHKFFAKLTIASKMLIGYLSLVVLTVIVVVYALWSLQHLNQLNSDIVKIDIPVQEAADKMLDALFAQDTYEKRYLILKGADMSDLFRKRSNEFRNWLKLLSNLPDSDRLPVDKISTLHDRYDELFKSEMRFVMAGDVSGATHVSNSELKGTFEMLLGTLRKMSAEAKQSQENRMIKIGAVGRSAFYTTAVLCIMSIALGVILGTVITHHISSSIKKLRIATGHVAEGDFHYDPQINAEDEIGVLAGSFVAMGKRLKKLEEMYLDASPLTRLPGGIAIENVVKRRIESGKPLAFCVVDLDYFKAFNDHYGYAHGNVVLKETAKIIEAAVKAKGMPDDFVGHVGGDDFVVITTPASMRDVSSEIMKVFDQRIPQFYDEKDRGKGFILGKNRQGQEMQFPLMTISIAIVTNEQHSFKSPIEVSEIAAELKDYAKSIPSSIYVVDKRRSA